jgi:hypothetical protein
MNKMALPHQIKSLASNSYPESLIKSWKKAYPDFKYRYPERFKWLHLKNPFGVDFSGSVFYIEVNGIAAAWTTVIYHKVVINNKIFKGAFGADTFCLEEFRRNRFASYLLGKTMENVDCRWSISLSTVNRKVILKKGFYEGRPFFHYFKVLTGLSKENFFFKCQKCFKS